MRLETFGEHARAADSREQDRAAPRFQGGDEVRAQQVARSLAGHHADAQKLGH
jgi:hypothetical protein